MLTYLLDDFEEKKEKAFVAWSQRVMEIVFAPVHESPALAPGWHDKAAVSG